MTGLIATIKRNSKLFFKDRGMLFVSLISPIILLVLYVTFLANVFRDSFAGAVEGIEVEQSLINGMVAGQLLSSILAVSCVTVAFCANMIMVQDKTSGARNDLLMSNAKKPMFALSYYISTAFVTLIVNLIAFGGCLIYVACQGWYMSVADVFLCISDIVLLVMFGTALSSIVNFFLSSQGQANAVGTIVSAGYGFISGAYMPISTFGKGLQNFLGIMPGTYGTSLIRNHSMCGAIREMERLGWPAEAIEGIKDSVDCNIYCFGNKVSILATYLIVVCTIVGLIGIYVLLNAFVAKKRK